MRIAKAPSEKSMPDPNRRQFLGALGGLAAAWAGGVQAQQRRPNVVLMIADDVGWNDLRCYGHPTIRTPHIDTLADQGVKFQRAFLPVSSCSPSRCCIITGRYPHSTGAPHLHDPLPADQVCFPALLREAGYYTTAAGKWHLGPAAQKAFDRIEPPGDASGCANWLKVLEERPKDKPFFAWLASVDAHRGWSPDALDPPYTAADARVPPYLPDTPEVRGDLAAYYNEITRLDQHVGRVLGLLDDQGVADNTLVIFISDNGRPFPRCKTTVYDSGVRTPLLARWPRLIDAGGQADGLVSTVDLAPTILAVAGVAVPETCQGRSFENQLRHPAAPGREFVYAEHNWHDYQAYERSARDKRWLYIRNYLPEVNASPPADAVRSPTYQQMIALARTGQLPPEQRGCFITPRPAEELYDTAADPFQLTNLAADPACGGELARLRAALDTWIEHTDDHPTSPPRADGFDRWTGAKSGG